MKEAYLAIDFGGGSGRVIAGYLSGDGTSFFQSSGADGRTYLLGFSFFV